MSFFNSCSFRRDLICSITSCLSSSFKRLSRKLHFRLLKLSSFSTRANSSNFTLKLLEVSSESSELDSSERQLEWFWETLEDYFAAIDLSCKQCELGNLESGNRSSWTCSMENFVLRFLVAMWPIVLFPMVRLLDWISSKSADAIVICVFSLTVSSLLYFWLRSLLELFLLVAAFFWLAFLLESL